MQVCRIETASQYMQDHMEDYANQEDCPQWHLSRQDHIGHQNKAHDNSEIYNDGPCSNLIKIRRPGPPVDPAELAEWHAAQQQIALQVAQQSNGQSQRLQ